VRIASVETRTYRFGLDPPMHAAWDPEPRRHQDATLVLVRHGESTFIAEGRFQGQADSPLTTTGFRQADLVARRLDGVPEAYALYDRREALKIVLEP